MNVRIRYPQRNTKQIEVVIGRLTLYFSYETVIAFHSPKMGLVISENIWTMTTGRHLNEIDPDKSIRLKHGDFLEKLSQTLKGHGLED